MAMFGMEADFVDDPNQGCVCGEFKFRQLIRGRFYHKRPSDPAVQKAAYEALGDAKGAAVAVDPGSGEILGMVSTPSYDPSKISGSTDGEAWQALSEDADKPMVNRALRQPLPPGSTFKLVVAAAALENGLYDSVDVRTDSPDPYTLPGTSTVLRNENAAAPCENARTARAFQPLAATELDALRSRLAPKAQLQLEWYKGG